MMRELETSLQEFGDFLLKLSWSGEGSAALYGIRRRFLTHTASNEPLADQGRF